MLNIIVLILKIIGIILASILGILVFLLCILFLVPLCYRVKGSGKNDKESILIEGRVTWLFRLLKFNFRYEYPDVSYEAKIAFYNLLQQNKDESPSEKKEDGEKQEQEVVKQETVKQQVVEEIAKEEVVKQEIPQQQAQKKEVAKENPREQEKTKQQEKQPWYRKIADKVKKLWEKIKYTFKRICANIKVLDEKKEKIKDFLVNETHKHAFGKVKKELFYLLKHYRPKKLKIHANLGFEDPTNTGRMLAGMSVLYPFYGDHVSVTPDFMNERYEGDFFFSGKIRLIHVLIVTVRLLVDRKVRLTIKHGMKFKL